VPELKLEHAVTAMRIGIAHATGPIIVFAATLYKMSLEFLFDAHRKTSTTTLHEIAA